MSTKKWLDDFQNTLERIGVNENQRKVIQWKLVELIYELIPPKKSNKESL